MVCDLKDGTEGVWVSEREKYERYDLSTIPWSTTGRVLYVPNPARLVQFDQNKIHFSDPVRMAFGGYKIDVKFNKEEFIFQTPAMCLPFGLTVFNNKKGKSKVLELDFYHRKYLSKVQDFYDACRALDYAFLQACIKNRAEWLPGLKKSKYKDGDIWKMYCGITRMRETKGGQVYEPRFTVKVWEHSSVMFPRLEPGQISDAEEDTMPITTETVEKKSWVVLQAHFTGLWITNGQISPGFRLTQGRLVDPPEGALRPTMPQKMKPTLVF